MTEADQKKTVIIEEKASDREPFDPPTVATHRAHSDVSSLSDKDEALLFLGSNPRREELVNDAQALLDDPLQRRKLLRKIDFAIVPLLGLAFLVNLLDKAALEFSAVMGLREDVHLKGQQFNNLGMLLFVGFIVVEVPTQLLAQRISRLGLYLGVNTVLWGITAACHAACTTYAALAVMRTLLGAFESCIGPIAVLIVAMWYKKSEQGRRISWFYAMLTFGLLPGSLTAYGVSFIKSKIAVWRILYLSVGLLTVCVGVLICILLPDSPVRARRFSEVEKTAVLLRKQEDQTGTQNSKIKREQIFETLRDGRIWLLMVIMALATVPSGGLTTFGSILLTSFGYSSQEALLMGAPRGAIGTAMMVLLGYLSDKFNDRSTLTCIGVLPAIMAISLMIAFDPNGIPSNKSALLAGSLLSIVAVSSIVLVLSWNASNIAGHTKKVMANALTMVSYAGGNILGTQTFRATEAPGYISGKISILACLSALCVCVIILRLWNDRLNKEKRRVLASMSVDQREALRTAMSFADVTDRENPFFVYTH